MNTQRRLARDYLDGATLSDFWEVVRQAKISDADQQILDARFVHGLTHTQISQQLHISPEKVKQTIQKAYDKIAKLI